MKDREFLLHLISELTNFVLENNPREMAFSLRREQEGVHLCVTDDRPRSEAELAAMREALNTEARPELADYYGTMGGSDLLGHARLNLVGCQIARAEVSSTDTGTRLDIWTGTSGTSGSDLNI